MKRKTLDDFYKPKKVLKLSEKFEISENSPNKESCESNSKPAEKQSIPEVFKKLMSTSQSSNKSNLHLEYQNFSQGKHQWSYSFEYPKTFTYKSKVHNLKKNSKDPTNILLTFTTTHKGSSPHFYNFSKRPSFSPSLLKSLLQKAIRRLNLSSSLKTSLQLGVNCGYYLYSIQELARRLCVIELEDVILHPDTPLLVWCMGVSDFEYSQEMLDSILQIVSDLARIEYSDVWVHQSPVNLYQLYKESNTISKCILIRAFYGGMTGDIKLLSDYAQTWKNRLVDPVWEEFLLSLYKDLPPVDSKIFDSQYSFEDTLLEGVDFHCSNILEWLIGSNSLVVKILEQGHKDPESYLKSSMWTYRSSINLRTPLNLHPQVGSLISSPFKIPDPPDEFFINEVLPLVTQYSISELKKRLKISY